MANNGPVFIRVWGLDFQPHDFYLLSIHLDLNTFTAKVELGSGETRQNATSA